MISKDQFLLENAYDQVLFNSVLQQYEQDIVEEGVFDGIANVSTALKELASINLSNIAAFIGKLGLLAKSVVVAGGLSTIGVFVVGSILKLIYDKRTEAEALSKESIIALAQANSKQQLEALAEQYEQGDDATKQRIIAQQNKVLTDAVTKIKDQSRDKTTSTATNLMGWVGVLLKQNSFILGLLLQVVLSNFGIISYPTLLK